VTTIKLRMLSRCTNIVFVVALLVACLPVVVSANPITARSVAIGSSLASADTTYSFIFTAAQSTTIKSVRFQACDTASGACTQTGGASGFSSASPGSTLASSSNLGSGGAWTVDNVDSTSLRIKNTGNTGGPSAGITANFSNVHNPSATNSTFFIRITTYSDDAWTTPIDTGAVATSTAGQVTATAKVDESLNFSLSVTNVDLGTLTKTTTGTGTSTMTVGTNASTGYTVTYAGNTLTSGSNTITAMVAAGASVQNSKQFGINLMANTTPSVGTNKTGTGSGTAATGYGTADQFKFNTSGETIASAAGPTNDNTFTTSYIANIDSATAAGTYNTVITYVVTANF
jgi:hypothetical protein